MCVAAVALVPLVAVMLRLVALVHVEGALLRIVVSALAGAGIRPAPRGGGAVCSRFGNSAAGCRRTGRWRRGRDWSVE